MTGACSIRPAGPEDAAVVAGLLGRLAEYLGDAEVFATTADTVRRYGFGPEAQFSCLLAWQGQSPVGLALYFPHFSTTRGLPGVYVQDLFVEPEMRGAGLGEALLAGVAAHAAQAWEAGYIKLSVHHGNPGAERFYDRLGFAVQGHDQPLILEPAGFAALRDRGAAS